MSETTPPENPQATLRTSRLLRATPDAVYAAFEDAGRLARWWGPEGFTNTFHEFDFRPDGRWNFTMHAPNGADFANESVFLATDRAERIVLEHVVTPWFRLTVTLDPDGDGTRLGWAQQFDSPEMADRMRTLAATANEQVLDRLEAVLAEG